MCIHSICSFVKNVFLGLYWFKYSLFIFIHGVHYSTFCMVLLSWLPFWTEFDGFVARFRHSFPLTVDTRAAATLPSRSQRSFPFEICIHRSLSDPAWAWHRQCKFRVTSSVSFSSLSFSLCLSFFLNPSLSVWYWWNILVESRSPRTEHKQRAHHRFWNRISIQVFPFFLLEVLLSNQIIFFIFFLSKFSAG